MVQIKNVVDGDFSLHTLDEVYKVLDKKFEKSITEAASSGLSVGGNIK